jgi:hypothetical protein
VTDLAALKQKGATITVKNTFEINEVDLAHEKNPFRAFLFFSRFNGSVDDRPYEFRKCYSRGCTHNLCPHVSQAVMIANRYLKRDYKKLENAGIEIAENFFTLEDMLAQFEAERDDFVSTLILEDYIRLAGDGEKIDIQVELENFPAVENFANYSEKRLFYSVNFHVTYLGETHICHRCFSCYAIAEGSEDRENAKDLANGRLAAIYDDFDKAGITYNRVFFE